MSNPDPAPANQPDTRPILEAVDRAIQDELTRWAREYELDEEFRLALARAVTLRLQNAGMLNYHRPWENPDRPA